MSAKLWMRAYVIVCTAVLQFVRFWVWIHLVRARPPMTTATRLTAARYLLYIDISVLSSDFSGNRRAYDFHFAVCFTVRLCTLRRTATDAYRTLYPHCSKVSTRIFLNLVNFFMQVRNLRLVGFSVWSLQTNNLFAAVNGIIWQNLIIGFQVTVKNVGDVFFWDTVYAVSQKKLDPCYLLQ